MQEIQKIEPTLSLKPVLSERQWYFLQEAKAVAERNEPTVPHEKLKTQLLQKINEAQT